MGKKPNTNSANSKGGGQSKSKTGSNTQNVKKKGLPANKSKGKSTVNELNGSVKAKQAPALSAKSKTTTLGSSASNKRQTKQPQKTPAPTTSKVNLFSKPAITSSISKGTSKGSSNGGGNSGGNHQKQDNSSLAGAHPKPVSDKSLLNIPHEVRIHGFSSLLLTVEKATPKVKQLLLNECDLIMECRSCRNLFRSYPNFINHKLNYCKSLFHPTADSGCSQFINKSSSNPSTEIQYYIAASSSPEDENTSTTQPKKTTSAEKQENMSVQIDDSTIEAGGPASSLYKNIQELNEENNDQDSEAVKLALRPVSGRTDSVMLQSKIGMDQSICDSSNNVFDNRDTAMLGPDGKVICTGTAKGMEKIVRHLSAQIFLAQQKMVQQSTNQSMCDICKTVFSTETALRQHRRDAPDCVIKQSSLKSSISAFDTVYSTINGSNERFPPTVPPEPPLNKSMTEENKQFVKQLFSRSSPNHLQRFAPTPTSTTSTINLNSKLSPYKKIVGKAVKNLHSFSSSPSTSTAVIPSAGKSPTDLKLSCAKCSKICQSFPELSYHMHTQCSSITKKLPAKIHRIGIEARTCYIKPEAIRPSTTTHQETLLTEKFQTTASTVLSLSADDSKNHRTNNMNFDVNCNVSAAGETMECDEHSDPKYSPMDVQFGGGLNNSAFGQNNLHYNVCSNDNVDSFLTNGISSSLVDQDEDQDTGSNITDSGVSSGSGTGTGDDHHDKFSSSMDSAINMKKSKLADDRILAPKNDKNLKRSAENEKTQPLKRVSVRNLQKPKSSAVGKQKTVHSTLNKKK